MILDDPKDAARLVEVLGQVLTQPPLQVRLGLAAAVFASHHQWREIALAQEGLYFSALAAKKTSNPA